MFSQQHYEALAKVLRETRQEITSALPKLKFSMGAGAAERETEIKHEAVNEFQFRLQALLKKDNPKFKELLFIGAASEHAPQPKR
jgi:hypothetical protein